MVEAAWAAEATGTGGDRGATPETLPYLPDLGTKPRGRSPASRGEQAGPRALGRGMERQAPSRLGRHGQDPAGSLL